MNIVYKPILTNLTGNTTDYSGVTGITSGIFISSGVTFNINDFYGNITRIDLIDNIVNYIDGYSINKYMLDILIVGNISGETLVFSTINIPLDYCIKLSYNNEIEDYLIIIVGEVSTTTTTTTIAPTTTTTTTIHSCSTTTTTTTTIIEPYTIFYTSDVTNELTGNTTTFSGSTGITSNIFIPSGITFNILDFDENIINRLDIIDNTINYIDNLDKYVLDTLIVDVVQNYTYVENLGEYCVKFSHNNVENYLIMNVISGNTTTTTTTIQHTTTTTTTTKIRIPTITYNYPISGTSWFGGGDVIPYNVFLPFVHNGFDIITTTTTTTTPVTTTTTTTPVTTTTTTTPVTTTTTTTPVNNPTYIYNETLNIGNDLLYLYNPYKNVGDVKLNGQLHCHTTNSDGSLTPNQLMSAYETAGFDFITITDHQVITQNPGNHNLIWLCNSYEDTKWGASYQHIMVYNTSIMTATQPLLNVINFFDETDSVLSYAHPDWALQYQSTQKISTVVSGLTFIEVYNGGTSSSDRGLNILLNNGLHVFAVAVDDTHIMSDIGKAYVQVWTTTGTSTAILNSLIAGEFVATTGTIINDVTYNNGDYIISTGSLSASTVFITDQSDGTPIIGETAIYTLLGTEKYVRAVVTYNDGKKCWIQPLFIL